MTPPLPVIPSQPTVAAATGGTWASGSGQTAASGSQLFSEYAEYRQWLNIEYSRNPRHTNAQARNHYYSLTQLSGVDVMDIGSTDLHVNITAHTSCTIVSGVYSASSFWQPQKLSMTPYEQDKEGISYGAVDGSGVVFGPHGTITTTQPYINRRPKTALDIAYNITNTGTSHILWASGGTGDYNYYNGNNTSQQYEFYLWPNQDLGHAQNYNQAQSQNYGYDSFDMYGAYNVSAEPGYLDPSAGMQRFEQFLEKTVTSLQNTDFRYRFAVVHPVNSDHTNYLVEGDKIPMMPYYNSGHHDYT